MAAVDFEHLVRAHSASLFRVARPLTGDDMTAADLVQQTFYRWASKGDQLRDPAKVRSWLLTTLHREYLGLRRHEDRFATVEVTEAAEQLPHVSPEVVEQLDGASVLHALDQLDEVYRAPVALFYLEDMSYREIAETLEVPVGTVMSRLARGKDQLRRLLQVEEDERSQKHRELRIHPPVQEVIHE